MTDTTTQSPEPSKAKPSRRAKWRRRIIFILATLFVGGLALRLLVSFLFPVVLNKVAAGYGFAASYDRMDLYFLGGDIGLFNLKFSPLEGGDSYLEAKYVRGSISVLQLLRGRLRVERAEAEETTLKIDRLADGSLPLLDRVMKNLSSAPSTPSNVQLEPPLLVDTFRLQNIKVRLRDQSVSPTFETQLFMNTMVSGLGDNRAPTQFDLQLYADNLLGILNVRGVALTDNNQLKADIKVNLNDFRPGAVASYLQQLGLSPGSQSIDAYGTGKIFLQPTVWPPVKNADPKNPPLTNAIAGTITLDHILATADAQPFARLDSLNVKIKAITPSEIRVSQIAIDGVHAAASRSAEGYLQLAGLQVGGAEPSTRPVVTRPTTLPAQAAAPTPLPLLELEDLTLSHVDFQASDRAMGTPVNAAVALTDFNIAHFSTDPATTQPTTVRIAGNAPGLARNFSITGQAEPSADNKTLQLLVKADGINPNAISPYLQAMGLRHDLHDASFACAVSGRARLGETDITGNVKLTNVTLDDQGKNLFSLPSVAINDLLVRRDLSLIRLGQIDVGAPHLLAGRAADGSYYALGLHTSPRTPAQPTTQPTPTTAPAAQPIDLASLPALEIGSLTWHGLAMELSDATVSPPRQLPITDAGVELKNIAVSFRPGAASKQGTYRAYVKLPQNIESLEINGHLTPSGKRLDFDCQATGDGIAIETFKPLLKQLGVESTLQKGRVEFAGSGYLMQRDDGIASDLTVATARFTDGQTEWAAVDSAHIAGAYFDGRRLTIDAINATRPRTLVKRDAKGQLTLAGLTILTDDKPKPPSTQPVIPSRIDLTLPLAARINSLTVDGAALTLVDAAPATPVTLRGQATVEAQNLSIGDGAVPAKISVLADLHGVCESFQAEGELLTAPAEQSAKFNVHAKNVTGSALKPYLPAGLEIALRDGQFHTAIDAHFKHHPAGGSSGAARLDHLSWTDDSQPLGHIDEALIDIDRFDLVNHRIDIKSIRVTGAGTHVDQTPAGLSALGMQIVPTTQPVARENLAAPTTQAVASVETMMEAARQIAPLVTIQSLDLRADRFTFNSHQLGRPVQLSNLQLVSTSPIELLGEDPAARRPFGLNITGKLDDVVGSMKIETRLAPCAAEPSVTADLLFTDITGAALTDFLPKLKDLLDGSSLTDARLTGHLQSTFQYTRRGMLGIDFARDIGAEFQLQNLSFTSPAFAEPLAGVQEMHGEKIKFSPGTGNVSVGSLEITKPQARAWRDQAGIHAMGLTIKLPGAPATQPTTQPAEVETAAPTPATAPTVVAASSSDMPEYRVDQLLVSGVDFEFVDRAGDVETRLPINDLDVQVQGFTSKMFTEPKPIRFAAVVGAGKVDLARRARSSDPTTLRTASTQPASNLEPRELFAQATATGNFVVYPQPQGWAKASVSAFELGSLRGISRQFGVNLGGGTMDALLDFRMNGTEDINVRPRLTFTDLSIADSDDGKLQKFFVLPAPLNVAIQLVQKPDGTISFPLEVQIKKQSFSIPQLIGTVGGAMGKVMGDALLSAPAKLASAPAALIGVDTSSWFKKKLPESLTLTFPSGESQLTDEQIAQLNALAEAMKHDDSIALTVKPALGESDLAILTSRANPSVSECATLVTRLRHEKTLLQQENAETQGELRAAIAAHDGGRVKTLQASLVAQSRQLGETELSLDDLLSMMRQGADKQAGRRTRAAALVVGQQRLENVHNLFKSVKIDNLTGRWADVSPKGDPEETASAGTVEVIVRRVAE